MGRGQHVHPARHQGHALQLIVDRDRRGDSWSACPCAQSRSRPSAAARPRCGRATRRRSDRARPQRPRDRNRAAGNAHLPPRCAGAAPPPTDAGRCPDRAVRPAHGAGRAARWPRPPARARSRRGCRSRDRRDRADRADPAPCRSRQNARTGGAPRRPSRSPAISGRRESTSRIRACSGGYRCPRCAPGRCRRSRARDASRSRPNRRSRDAARRSGWGQNA